MLRFARQMCFLKSQFLLLMLEKGTVLMDEALCRSVVSFLSVYRDVCLS